MNTRIIPRLAGALLLIGGAVNAQPLRVDAEAATPSANSVYRCRALDGSTLFQDRPCHQSAATVEARSGAEGTRINADAPPPAEDPAAVTARYRRYLDQVEADRRIAAEADTARAARLKAEAEVESARRDDERWLDDCDRDGFGCDPGFESNRWLPVFFGNGGRPIRRPPIIQPQPPVPAPGPRPTRPLPREPRDVRSEILDTRR